MAARRELPPTKRGYDAHEVVSALQKAVRRSDPHAALYWAFELERSGFGAWAWARVRVMVSEDIGVAAPVGFAADVRALYDNWQKDPKHHHAPLFLAHAVILIATAPKSRLVDWAVWHHVGDYTERLPIPDEARDRHTLAGKRKGRGWQHFLDVASVVRDYADTEEARSARLREFEADYRVRAQAKIDVWEHGAQPDHWNPWDAPYESASAGTEPKPAHNPPRAESGQLWDEESR